MITHTDSINKAATIVSDTVLITKERYENLLATEARANVLKDLLMADKYYDSDIVKFARLTLSINIDREDK